MIMIIIIRSISDVYYRQYVNACTVPRNARTTLEGLPLLPMTRRVSPAVVDNANANANAHYRLITFAANLSPAFVTRSVDIRQREKDHLGPATGSVPQRTTSGGEWLCSCLSSHVFYGVPSTRILCLSFSLYLSFYLSLVCLRESTIVSASYRMSYALLAASSILGLVVGHVEGPPSSAIISESSSLLQKLSLSTRRAGLFPSARRTFCVSLSSVSS